MKTIIDRKFENSKESATLFASKVVEEKRQHGEPVINFGLGQNPLGAPEELIAATKEFAAHKNYTPVEGSDELKQILVNRYKSSTYDVSSNGVIVGPGLKNLIFNMQAIFGGDIFHVSPSWVSYAEQTKLLGKKAKVIETSPQNQYKLTPRDLERSILDFSTEPKLIIFNHPVNPTGAIYTPTELSQLADAFKKHNFVVFADEVYFENFHNKPCKSIADYYPEGTIRASSISKMFAAGGDRVGWAIFPSSLCEYKKHMAAMGSSTYSCAPVVQQHAAAMCLEPSEEVDLYLAESNWIYKNTGLELAKRFEAAGFYTTKPEAAWYFLVSFERFRAKLENKNIHTNTELAKRLIEDLGIVTVSGSEFYLDERDLTLRISYVDFDTATAWQMAREIDCTHYEGTSDVSRAWASKMLEAVDMIIGWLN